MVDITSTNERCDIKILVTWTVYLTATARKKYHWDFSDYVDTLFIPTVKKDYHWDVGDNWDILLITTAQMYRVSSSF